MKEKIFSSRKESPATVQQELTPSQSIIWPRAYRIGFRFVFAFVLLFLGSFAGFFAPFSMPVAAVSQVIWEALVPWVASHILHVPPPTVSSDGDGLGHWIQLTCCGIISVAVTLIWSAVDRRRNNYVKLHEWLQVILRYALGLAMVYYGLAKVFHLQMLPPHLAKLVQPYGDSSPTSLLWILMGSSGLYSMFTGAVELIGGFMLFNRHTTALGALISFGALIHVVVLNLSYDVSVKLWSMSLLTLTLVLLAPHLRRLGNVLVFNRPCEPVEFPPLFRRPKTNRIAFRVGMTCLTITIAFRLLGMVNGRGQAYRRTPVELHGIYNVATFTSNGDLLPPLLTDEKRWRTVIIERSGMASIRLMNDRVLDYLTSVDSANGAVTFLANPDATVTTAGATRLAYNPRLIEQRFEEAIEADADAGLMLEFSRPGEDLLDLRGQWGSDSIDVQLSRVDESKFLLLSRGFHWIQSYPFFR